MKNIIPLAPLTLFINLFLCLQLLGDEIITKDGSRIVGALVLFEDGNLTFKTSFAGKIKISTTEISSFSTENEISIRLEDNRTFESKIRMAKESTILIEDNQIEPTLDEVRHLWPSSNEDPLVVEIQKKHKLLL